VTVKALSSLISSEGAGGVLPSLLHGVQYDIHPVTIIILTDLVFGGELSFERVGTVARKNEKVPPWRNSNKARVPRPDSLI